MLRHILDGLVILGIVARHILPGPGLGEVDDVAQFFLNRPERLR